MSNPTFVMCFNAFYYILLSSFAIVNKYFYSCLIASIGSILAAF